MARRTAPLVRNPILYRHSFWVLGRVLPDGRSAEKHAVAETATALAAIGKPPPAQVMPADPGNRWNERRLWPQADVDWTASPEAEADYFAEIYQHHDVIGLTLAHRVERGVRVDDLAALRPPAPGPDELGSRLGTALVELVFVARVRQVQATAAAMLGEGAMLRLAALTLDDDETIWIADDARAAGLGATARLCVIALVAKGGADREGLAHFCNATVRDLLRLAMKVADQRDQTDRMIAEGYLETKAEGLTAIVSLDPRSEDAVSSYERFAACLRDYAGDVVAFRQLTASVEINLGNFSNHVAALKQRNPGRNLGWLTGLEQAMMHALSQQRADMQFLDASLRQANSDLAGLQVRSDLALARQGRRESRASNVRALSLAVVGTALAFAGLVDSDMAVALTNYLFKATYTASDPNVVLVRLTTIGLGALLSIALLFAIVLPLLDDRADPGD